MNKKLLLGIVLLLLVILVGTLLYAKTTAGVEGAYRGVAMPNKRPSDIRITYSFGGGMLGDGFDVYLSERESYSRSYMRGTETKVSFSVTPEELDRLYAVFKQKHFERVTWKSELVYDGAGGTVSVGWGANNISKDLGSGVTYKKNGGEVMNAVESAIDQLVQKKVAALKVPVTMSYNRSITHPELLTVSFNYGPEILKATTTMPMIPGDYWMDASLAGTNSGSASNAQNESVSVSAKVTIPNRPTKIIFSKRNNSLHYTLQ